MGVCSNYSCNSSIKAEGQSLLLFTAFSKATFFSSGFRMEIHEDQWSTLSQISYHGLSLSERVVDAHHIHPALKINDSNLNAGNRLYCRTFTYRGIRVVKRPEDIVITFHDREDLILLPDMVSAGYDIYSSFLHSGVVIKSNAEASCCILSIAYDEICLVFPNGRREP